MACAEGLWELGLFSVKIRRQREDFVEVFSYLKGGYKEDGACLFSGECCRRTRDQSPKFRQGKVCLERMKNKVTMRVIKHWNRLPRTVLGSLTLEILKAYLDKALSNLVLLVFPSIGAGLADLQRSLSN